MGLLNEYRGKYPQLFEYASALSGLPKSFGVHPCGVCVCVEPAMRYNAIEFNDNKKTWVLQGDMHTADDLGLVKIDLLGLRTLDAIYDTLEMIGKDYDYITPTKINLHDEDVWNEFKQGNTDCIFQFESDGMKKMLKDMSCDSIENLSAANALYRPGAKNYIDNYVNRKNGKEEIVYLNDDLRPILANTYGIIVFQEQLIEIGRLAGLRNPDELRKATAKKKPELMAKIEPELKNGLMRRGWTQEQVDTLWNTILEFARYSFNKCVRGDTRILLPDGTSSPTVAEMTEDSSLIPSEGISLHHGLMKRNKIVAVTPAGERYLYKIETENGCYVECTPNHKIPTTNGIVKAEQVEIGDLLYTYDVKYGKRYRLSKVQSVTFSCLEESYDVEMAGPMHNFVTSTGLVVCNSHSTAYALTAYISMYLKVHHTAEFFTGMINSYEDTDDIAGCVAEGRRMGLEFVIDKWDEAQNRTYCKDGVVHLGLQTFKGFGSDVATILQNNAKNAQTAFQKCAENCLADGINETQLRNMVKLGMFSEYGKSATLLKILDYRPVLTRSQYDKDKCPYDKEIVARFSKETAKQFRNIDGEGLFGYLCSQLESEDISLRELINTQVEVLGYILYRNPEEDPRYATVLSVDTKYTPTVLLYGLRSGKVKKFKIHSTHYNKGGQKKVSTIFNECPLGPGDMICVSAHEKLPKMKKLDNGKFAEVPGVFEQWITDYHKVLRI